MSKRYRWDSKKLGTPSAALNNWCKRHFGVNWNKMTTKERERAASMDAPCDFTYKYL